jgi:hypothetical protein
MRRFVTRCLSFTVTLLTGVCIALLVMPLNPDRSEIRAVVILEDGSPPPVAKRAAVPDEASKTVDCGKPDGYSVVEGQNPGTNDVNIVADGKVLWSIRLPTGIEHNGFGFNWAKKTKEGFEISVEYGSRYHYAKRFNFICKRGKFYLSNIIVDNFDKADPEKWTTKVIRVKPNLPLEKFLIDDFMLEGVVE